MPPPKKPKGHLLDEDALERQVPIERRPKGGDGNDDDDGSDGSWASSGDLPWELEPYGGDLVQLVGYPLDMYALVVRGAEELRDASEEHTDDDDDPDKDEVEVWFCRPCFAGDRSQLLVTCPASTVLLVDRKLNVNQLVWMANDENTAGLTPGLGREGMILRTTCKVTGLSIGDVSNYLLTNPKMSKRPITADVPPNMTIHTGNGENFFPSNPFSPGVFVVTTLPEGAEGFAEDDVADEKHATFLSGHVTGVQFHLLVQVLGCKKKTGKHIFVCNDVAGLDTVVLDAAESIPPQLDALSSTMKFTIIDSEFFSTSVVWVSGTYESLQDALLDSTEPVRCMLLFAFPAFIMADDFITGVPREHKTHAVMPAESYLLSCFAGATGFLLPDSHPLVKDTFERSKRRADKRPTSRINMPHLTAINDFYVQHGIVAAPGDAAWSPAQWTAYWQDRVSRLSKILPYYIVCTSTVTTSDVIVRDTGKVETGVRNSTLAPMESHWNDDHDLFPFHVCCPSELYVDTFAGTTLDDHHDPKCPLFDCWPVYQYGTELEVGEPVQPRVMQEQFIIRGQDAPDPPYLGFLHRVDKESQMVSVTWFKQAEDGLALMRARPFGTGQILELMHNTKVRVQWEDGTVEEVFRSQIVPCRADDAASDDEGSVDGMAVAGAEAEAAPPGEVEEASGADVSGLTEVPWASGADAPDQQQQQAPSRWAWLSRAASSVGSAVSNVRAAFKRGRELAAEEASVEGAGAAPLPAPLEAAAALVAPQDATDDDLEKIQEEINAELNLFASAASAASKLPEEAEDDDGNGEEDPSQAASVCRTEGEFSSCAMFTSHLLWDRQDAAAFAPVNALVFQRRVVREIAALRRHCDIPLAEPAVFPSLLIKSAEDEPRLVKFVMMGPMHTPYYQSFLAFDLACPDQFPIAPPTAKFHAYGVRLNPNLYDDGYICLSLLGTWEGHAECERWSPAVSSILQVALSIQSLVLVKEPYYNEADFEQYRGQDLARVTSKAYSESVALLRLKHLQSMLHAPPPDWTYEFRRYCRGVAPKMLDRLGRLLADHSDGKHASVVPGSITADGLVLPLSAGFAVSLGRMLRRLQETLQAKVADWAAEEARFSLQEE